MSTTPVSQLNVETTYKNSSVNQNMESQPVASESDHAMYLGMMALLNSIGRSEVMGASLADLSKVLYDTLVENGVKQVEKLQDELEFLNFFLEHFDQYRFIVVQRDVISALEYQLMDENPISDRYQNLLQQIAVAKEELRKMEAGLPDEYKGRNPEFELLARTYTRKSGARSYVNGVSQQLSQENNAVSSNKQIPDALQSQIKTLVLDQGVLVGQMTSFLRVIQRQLQYGHG